MKKIVLIALPALALIASCSKTEVTPVQSDPQQIAFTPLNGKLSTRAMIDGTAYANTDPSFGSLAYYLEDGKKWNSDMASASLYVPISKISWDGSTYWTTEKPYYWPKTGGVTFFAWSPYSYAEGGDITVKRPVDANDNNKELNDGIVIANYNVDVHQLTDLMVADVTKSKDQVKNIDANTGENKSNYKGVPIIFQHKLSQIEGINLKTVKTDATTSKLEEHDYANKHTTYEAGDVVFKLKNVSINLLNTVGTFTYAATNTATPTSVWSGQTTPKDTYVWYNYVSDNSDAPEQFTNNTKFELTFKNKHTANANAYLLVLPQPLKANAANTVYGGTGNTATEPYLHLEYQVLTYTDATNYATENVTENVDLYSIHNTVTAPAIEIAQNKKITYNIQINLENRQIYWAPSVVDWEAQKSFTYTIE